MVLCPSGSGAKLTAPPYAWINWLQAQAWLGPLSSKYSWLSYLLEPILVTTATFCASEPTQPVYPGDATVVAAATDPRAFETIIQYLKDSAIWFTWSQLCECNASGAPGCLTQMWSHASNPPTAIHQTDHFEAVDITSGAGGYTLWGIDVCAERAITQRIFWFDVPTTITHFETVTMVAGWQRFYFTTPLAMVSGQKYRIGISSIDASTFDSWYGHAGHTVTLAAPLVLNGFQYGPSNFATATPETFDVGIDPVICVGSPAAYSPPEPPLPVTSLPDVPTSSCTTVADLCVLINPMINQITLLKDRLDLLQRRLVPFAWIAGTPHPGLTGNGTITVQDALGCIINVTTIPGTWGFTYERPKRYIPQLASIKGSTSAGVDDSRQIHYPDQLVLFDDPWATGIHYDVAGGIVLTITPIFPEP